MLVDVLVAGVVSRVPRAHISTVECNHPFFSLDIRILGVDYDVVCGIWPLA